MGEREKENQLSKSVKEERKRMWGMLRTLKGSKNSKSAESE